MESSIIVRVVEVARNRFASFGDVVVVAYADLVVLERSHEPCADRVIRRLSRTASANNDRIFAQHLKIGVGDVGTAAIGVVNQTALGFSSARRHLQRFERQRRAIVRRKPIRYIAG